MKPLKSSQDNAFSLVEILLAVLALAILGGIAVPVFHNTRTKVDATKLNVELATLNSAAKGYLTNGGKFETGDSAVDVLEKLKRELSDDKRKTHVGFTGSLVDRRLKPILIDDQTKGTRLVWSHDKQRFETTTELVAGIKSFVLSDYSGKGDTAREAQSIYEYSDDNNGWVWNHGDSGTKNLVAPSNVPTMPVSDDDVETPIMVMLAPPEEAPGPPALPPFNPVPLSAPVFSVAPGAYPITDFNLPVVINDLNPGSVSDLYYSVDFGEWTEYTGPVSVSPDSHLRAQSVATREDFLDSPVQEGSYQASEVTLSPPSIVHDGPFNLADGFPVTVTMTHENEPAVSRIQFRINGGSWEDYLNELTLFPEAYMDGANVEARTVSTSEYYRDSALVSSFIDIGLQYIDINFKKLTTSAGFLNEGYLVVNGVEHQFLNSDAAAGGDLDVSVLVDHSTVNQIDVKVYTTPRPHDYTTLNYDSATDGLIEVALDDSFAGEAGSSAKVKKWNYGQSKKLEFAFEDLANVDPFGWGSDWDYNDYNFEITVPGWLKFNFGNLSIGYQGDDDSGYGGSYDDDDDDDDDYDDDDDFDDDDD